MKRFIVAGAFLPLVIPLALSAQTIPPQNTTCTQTDPVALAGCLASTTPATTSTSTPATTTAPFEIPVPLSTVSVREALTTWLQKNTPIFLDAQSWLNVGPLSANTDSANASTVIADLQKSLDQNAFIDPNSYFTPKTGPTVATPTTTSTSPEIQAEITAKLLLVQEILAKIDAIKATMPASSAPDTNAPPSQTFDTASLDTSSFTKTLQLGSEGDDVKSLQQFLAQDPKIYPEARITGYFGSLTRAAVGRWQIAHQIVSDESADGFGIVGPKTRAAIMERINSGSTTTATQSNTSTDTVDSSDTSIAPTTQSNGSTDTSSLDGSLSAIVAETDTLITSPAPTDTPPVVESETESTLPSDDEDVYTLPIESGTSEAVPPEWIGLKWF